MGLNYIIGELACIEMNKFNGDDTLYEAIVTADTRLIRYLVNGKYRNDIINKQFIKEPISIAKMVQAIEEKLDGNKRIRLVG